MQPENRAEMPKSPKRILDYCCYIKRKHAKLESSAVKLLLEHSADITGRVI